MCFNTLPWFDLIKALNFDTVNSFEKSFHLTPRANTFLWNLTNKHSLPFYPHSDIAVVWPIDFHCHSHVKKFLDFAFDEYKHVILIYSPDSIPLIPESSKISVMNQREDAERSLACRLRSIHSNLQQERISQCSTHEREPSSEENTNETDSPYDDEPILDDLKEIIKLMREEQKNQRENQKEFSKALNNFSNELTSISHYLKVISEIALANNVRKNDNDNSDNEEEDDDEDNEPDHKMSGLKNDDEEEDDDDDDDEEENDKKEKVLSSRILSKKKKPLKRTRTRSRSYKSPPLPQRRIPVYMDTYCEKMEHQIEEFLNNNVNSGHTQNHFYVLNEPKSMSKMGLYVMVSPGARLQGNYDKSKSDRVLKHHENVLFLVLKSGTEKVHNEGNPEIPSFYYDCRGKKVNRLLHIVFHSRGKEILRDREVTQSSVKELKEIVDIVL